MNTVDNHQHIRKYDGRIGCCLHIGLNKFTRLRSDWQPTYCPFSTIYSSFKLLLEVLASVVQFTLCPLYCTIDWEYGSQNEAIPIQG